MLKYAPTKNEKIVNACIMAGHMLRAVAEEHNITLDGPGWVDYRPIKQEVMQLKQYFNKFAFSPAYERWSANCRQRLATELARDDMFRAAAHNWPDVPEEYKVDIIRDLGGRQITLYSDQNNLFPAKRVRTSFYTGDAAGKGDTNRPLRAQTFDRLSNWRCDIRFNTHPDCGFDDFKTAINTAFHEHIHVVQFSLGGIFPYHAHPDEHMLGADMEMLWRVKGPASQYGHIKPLYFANPLERDAWRQSKQFIRTLTAALHEAEKQDAVSGTTLPAPR